MIGSNQPQVLGEFYGKVFDKKPEMQEDSWYGFMVGSCFITIGEHSEVKGSSKEPQRIIVNLETTEVKQEFERIKGIEGAEVIKDPYELMGAWIATFADPDGNYFQLMTPWKD